MSLFVRVDCSFFTHRKTARLRTAIGDAAFWLPIRLWVYAAQHQPDGDFSDYTAAELALHLGYQADATSMLQALLAAGFINHDLTIHDWSAHNGFHAAYRQRAQVAAKARWDRSKSSPTTPQRDRDERRGEENRGEEVSNACSITGSVEASSEAKNEEKMRRTKTDVPTMEMALLHGAKIGLPDSEAEAFFNYYESNGWRVGKNPMKNWHAAMANWRKNWQEKRTNKPGTPGYDRTKDPKHRDFGCSVVDYDTRALIERKRQQLQEKLDRAHAAGQSTNVGGPLAPLQPDLQAPGGNHG